MTTARKVNLLYKKAHGQTMDASAEEKRELRKYHVARDDGFYATKANLKDYVNAVDNHKTVVTFATYCQNRGKADKRRSGSSKEEMESDNRTSGFASIFVGWLTWGMAVYWIFKGHLTVGQSIVIACVISFILSKITSSAKFFVIFVLPLVLLAFFAH